MSQIANSQLFGYNGRINYLPSIGYEPLAMNLICPECKNAVDLSSYPNLQKDTVVECGMCGMTLLVTAISSGGVSVEIMDEGK